MHSPLLVLTLQILGRDDLHHPERSYHVSWSLTLYNLPSVAGHGQVVSLRRHASVYPLCAKVAPSDPMVEVSEV